MPHNRYYIDTPLEADLVVSLGGDEWHHLAHVSRGRIGECVELINGKGILALGQIEEIRKKEGTLLVKEILEHLSPPPPVIMCLALSRMNHLEWAVEKATELGASSLWLFPGALSDKDSLSTNQLVRLHSLVLAATKQCGRLDLPSIKWIPSWNEMIGIEGSVFLCDTAPEAPYIWELLEMKPLKLPILFLIGPESGFNEKEVHFFKTALKAQGVRLHPHILRTETAPLVALSLVQRYTNGII